MKKFILLVGFAAMLSASPAFAAMKPMAHDHPAMCMLHGKKILCHHVCVVHGKKVWCVYNWKHHMMFHKKHHVMHKVVVKKKKY